jgi:SPP1 gp7 family putative phage head morphogenesis protein
MPAPARRLVRHPDAEAAGYLRLILRQVVEPARRATLEAMAPVLEQYAQAQGQAPGAGPAAKADDAGLPGLVRRTLGAVELRMGRTLNSPELAAEIARTASAVDAAGAAAHARLLALAAKEAERKVGGKVPAVNVFADNPALRFAREAWVRENVARIRTLTSDTFAEIEGQVVDAMTAGERHTELAKRINARFDNGASRAALIARDQVAKFTGSLAKTRQQAAGVQWFRWSSSLDERVRPSHRAVNGQEFSWDALPVLDGEEAYPGQPIQCRCVAIPILHPAAGSRATPPAPVAGEAEAAAAEHAAFMAPRRAAAVAERAAAKRAAFGASVSEGLRASHARRRAAAEAAARVAAEAARVAEAERLAEAARLAAEAEERRLAIEAAARAAAEAARLEAERLAREAEERRVAIEAAERRKAEIAAKISAGLKAAAEAKRVAKAAAEAAAVEAARVAAEAARVEAERLAREAEAKRLAAEAEAKRKAEIAAKISAGLKAAAEAKRVAKAAAEAEAKRKAEEAAKAAAAAAAAAATKAAEAAALAAKKAATSAKISAGLKASAAAKAAAKAAASGVVAPPKAAPAPKPAAPPKHPSAATLAAAPFTGTYTHVVSITGSGGVGEATLLSGKRKALVLGPLGGVRTAGLTEAEFKAIRTRQLLGYGRSLAEATAMAAKEWADFGLAPVAAATGAPVLAPAAAGAAKAALLRGVDPALADAELKRLTPVQRKAYDHVQDPAVGRGYKEERARIAKALEAKFSKADLDRLRGKFASVDLTVNVPAGKKVGGKTIMELATEAGRSKSLFETGHGNGSTNLSARGSWERSIFGDNYEKGKPTERPIYGALHLAGTEGGAASMYGDAYLRLKPEVKARTTFTRGNSSGSALGEAASAHDAMEEAIRAVGGTGAVTAASDVDELFTSVQRRYRAQYFEAQFHGGIDWTRDIAEMVLPHDLATVSPSAHRAAVDFAAKHKIPVRMAPIRASTWY